MDESAGASSSEAHPDLSKVEPIKSTVVSQGLISFPDVLSFWRRWETPQDRLNLGPQNSAVLSAVEALGEQMQTQIGASRARLGARALSKLGLGSSGSSRTARRSRRGQLLWAILMQAQA